MRYHGPIVSDPPLPPAQGAALHDAKRGVRERVLAARGALSAAARAAASEVIAARLVALPSFGAARTILATLPFRTEWDARLFVAHALAAGKTVVSPRVEPARRMLTLHRIRDLTRDVAPGYRGISEPLPHCPEVAPDAVDWVLVPGVAFDPAGRRLGYGGGYYDRLLPLVPAAAPRVAGAFDVQMVAAVPAGPHDLLVDAIVTEARIVSRAPDEVTAPRAGVALAATLGIQIFVSLAATAAAVLAPEIAQTFDVAPKWIGVFVSLIYVGAMFASLASGGFIERYGAIRVSQACVVLCIAGALLVAFAPARAPALLVVAALVLGVGYGPITPASSHVLIRAAPPRSLRSPSRSSRPACRRVWPSPARCCPGWRWRWAGATRSS